MRNKHESWLTPEGLMLLESWARDGLTDEQIAKNMGIYVSTLYRWKKSNCEICEALKRGKDVVDVQVENALLKRALGFEYNEVMTEQSEDGVKKRVTRKMVVPDVTAQIYWLNNRKPSQWRNRREEEPKRADTSLMEALVRVVTGND